MRHAQTAIMRLHTYICSPCADPLEPRDLSSEFPVRSTIDGWRVQVREFQTPTKHKQSLSSINIWADQPRAPTPPRVCVCENVFSCWLTEQHSALCFSILASLIRSLRRWDFIHRVVVVSAGYTTFHIATVFLRRNFGSYLHLFFGRSQFFVSVGVAFFSNGTKVVKQKSFRSETPKPANWLIIIRFWVLSISISAMSCCVVREVLNWSGANWCHNKVRALDFVHKSNANRMRKLFQCKQQ